VIISVSLVRCELDAAERQKHSPPDLPLAAEEFAQRVNFFRARPAPFRSHPPAPAPLGGFGADRERSHDIDKLIQRLRE
jgi:hypothetical protein